MTVENEQPTATAAAETPAPEGAGDAPSPETAEQPKPSKFEQRMSELRASLEDAADETDDETDDDADDEGGETDGDATAEGDGEPEQDGDGGDPLHPPIRLPGRRDGDEAFELPLGHPKVRAVLEELGVDVEQAIDRTRQAANGFARRQQVEAERIQLEEEREQLQAIVQELGNVETLPDFVLGHVNPKAHRALAERLLMALPDADYRALLETVDTWEARDGSRENAATRAENERLAADRRRRQSDDAARPHREWGRQASLEVARLAESMGDEDANDFFDFALSKLQAHITSTKKLPKPSEIPALLKELRVLDRFGLAASADEATPAATRQPAATGPKKPAAPGKAKNTGETLKARADRRRNATTAPAGAGSAAVGPTRLPRGQSFEQRMGSLRKKLGLPPKRGG